MGIDREGEDEEKRGRNASPMTLIDMFARLFFIFPCSIDEQVDAHLR